jgi:nucleotide-binding universal stress UspA family protein
MLNSVLLHLEDAEQASPVIRLGVDVARQSEARLRGLTLLDTRRTEATHNSESAVYAMLAQARRDCVEQQHEIVREELSKACLAAGLNFDIRRRSGDPLQLLPQESQFHDLMITSLATQPADGKVNGLTVGDLFALLLRGAHPLLIVNPNRPTIGRVLLAYDGSQSSGRAIRSFLSTCMFPDAEHRLLALGRNRKLAKSSLAEMADYCLQRCPTMEMGYVCGQARRLLLPYAEKWQADLIVLGVGRGQRLLGRLLGDRTIHRLHSLGCSVFVAC